MIGVNLIDEIEFDDNGNLKAVKGHIEPIKCHVIGEGYKNKKGLTFSKETVMTLHEVSWREFNGIEYCGG